MPEATAGAPAPESPVAPTPPSGAALVSSSPDTPESEEAATPEGGEQQPVETQPKTYSESDYKAGVSKAVSERISKERRRLERTIRAEVERDYLRQQMEQGRGGERREEAQPKGGRPNKDDFKDVDSYLDAVADWKFEQREAQRDRESAERTREQSVLERRQHVVDKFADAEEQHPGLIDRLREPDVKLTTTMLNFVVDKTNGFQVGEYLAENTAESRKIAAMDPIDQVEALNALRAKLTQKPAPTRAPAPLKPSDPNAPVAKEWKDMSTAEHINKFNAEQRDKRKGIRR